MPTVKHKPEFVNIDGHGLCEVMVVPKVSSPVEHKHYVLESFVHPAKMSVMLCREIIRRYTKKGEVVLDPMAGIGTTLSEAVLLGRNAVGVELEKKFCDLTKKNIKLLKKLKTSAPKGKAVVIKGDSRELSKLLGEKADEVIFSPPYRERYAYKNPEERQKDDPTASKRNRIHKPYSQDPNNIGNLNYGKPVDAVVTSPPFFSTVQERGYQGRGKHNIAVDPTKHGHKGIITLYARSRENIDNIEKYGQVDAIVTSPPFKTANEGGGLNKNPPKTFRGVLKKHSFKLSDDPRNVDNLPYGKGVDAVITSPPFEKTLARENPNRKKGYWKGSGGYQSGHGTEGYGETEGNIGKLPHGKVDSVIFSPPYSDILLGPRHLSIEEYKEVLRRRGVSEKNIKKIATPASLTHELGDRYGRNPNNIGNLSHGQVDAVISSPPYSESMSKRRKGYTTHPELSKTRHMGLDSSDKNIGNLKHGKVDAVITSPPYSNAATSGKAGGEKGKANIGEFQIGKSIQHGGYSKSKQNIGNFPMGNINSIITSPPYEGSLESTTRHTKGGIPGRDKKLGQNGTYAYLDETVERLRKHGRSDPKAGGPYGKSLAHPYSSNKDNIGNKKGETYLQAMFQVYRECFKTLKPSGKMVLVIKDFVRNKRVVRLDLDTKRLCEAVGFRWVETKLFRLPSKSFWRTLYEKKYPEVDTSLLRFEFVEIFEKPMEAWA